MTRSHLALLLAIPVAAAALAVSHAGSANAIAGGDAVPEGQYLFSVKLTMTGIPTPGGGRRDSGCSGALIAPEWVITAGHCFRDATGTRVERPVADTTIATVGRADVTQPGGHDAAVIEVHQSQTADVAVARLGAAITDIAPLLVGDVPPAIGDVVRLTGFGSTTSVNPAPSNQLNTGQFTVASLTDSITGVTGLAPSTTTSPCQFDSGGAFFSEADPERPVLVSVVSDGPSCPHAEIERSARTDNLASWIRGITDPAAGVTG